MVKYDSPIIELKQVKQLFDIAVKDRIIAESPFGHVTTRWRETAGAHPLRADHRTISGHCG